MRRINRQARLHLLDLCGPPLLFAVARVCDQTWVYVTTAEGDGDSTVHADALLLKTREEAEALVAKIDRDSDAWLREMIAGPNESEPWRNEPSLQQYYRDQLALPIEDRYSHPWIEEVRGEASFKARPDTW